MNINHSISGTYWKSHSASWESGAYYRSSIGTAHIWDRLSSIFRGNAMYRRMDTALELLHPYIRRNKFLDAGCGSGLFAHNLIHEGALKVYGIDIAQDSIASAKKRYAAFIRSGRLQVRIDDLVVPAHPFPAVDIVTALGVIEYFDTNALTAFLHQLRTSYVFFDFPHPNRTHQFPTWQLRHIYVTMYKLPGIYLYTPDEFSRIAWLCHIGELRVIEKNGFYFITNLPIDPKT